MKKEAKSLKIGDRFRSGKTIQEVKAIERITDKAITFRTKRISPDVWDGDFFQRKSLKTLIEIV